jgi:hypothetical protein
MLPLEGALHIIILLHLRSNMITLYIPIAFLLLNTISVS